MATDVQRHHMRGIMDFLHNHQGQVDYPPHDNRGSYDARTFRLTEQQMDYTIRAGGHIMGDCSELATEICKWAGLADPNGLHYRYAGYTGTMLSHLPHYHDPSEAGVGALCVFGPSPGHHVVLVYEKGKDPLVWSHGRPGVDIMKLSQMQHGQPHPATFLAIAHL